MRITVTPPRELLRQSRSYAELAIATAHQAMANSEGTAAAPLARAWLDELLAFRTRAPDVTGGAE